MHMPLTKDTRAGNQVGASSGSRLDNVRRKADISNMKMSAEFSFVRGDHGNLVAGS